MREKDPAKNPIQVNASHPISAQTHLDAKVCVCGRIRIVIHVIFYLALTFV